MLIKKVMIGASVLGVSEGGAQYGVLQFGDNVYQEIPLGDSHNLQEFIRTILKVEFRNDSNNDVEAAIEAATEMLEHR